MRRRDFIGIFCAFAAGPAFAQSGAPGRRWDELSHDERVHMMERMRGRRHEPKWEEMRERWDRMPPEQRRAMMERHHGRRERGEPGVPPRRGN